MPAVRAIGNWYPLGVAADLLGYPRTTLNLMARQGRFPGAVQFGSRWFVPGKVVDALLAGDPLPPGVEVGPPLDDAAGGATA